MGATHACLEIRVGVPARTFCGLEVVQWERDKWCRTGTLKPNPVSITRRDIETVTCGRCFRSCD